MCSFPLSVALSHSFPLSVALSLTVLVPTVNSPVSLVPTVSSPVSDDSDADSEITHPIPDNPLGAICYTEDGGVPVTFRFR